MTQGIHVQFSGATVQDVRNQAAAFLAEFEGEAAVTHAIAATIPLAETKARRGRPPKSEEPVAATSHGLSNGKTDSGIFDDEETLAAVSTKTITKEDLNGLVQKVLSKVGGEKTLAILNKFGAKSTGALKVEDYPKVAAECEKALA